MQGSTSFEFSGYRRVPGVFCGPPGCDQVASTASLSSLAPEGWPSLQAGGKERVPISSEVWSFFRNVSAVRELGERLHLQVDVIETIFDSRRRWEYHEEVIQRIRDIRSPMVVLLDPDTGIAPKKPSAKHVTLEEIAGVWDVLKPRDWIVVYQHRSRNKTWKKDSRERLASICGNDLEEYCAPEIAPDVLFLAKQKS